MEKILKKANKDFERQINTPIIDDIISFKGFLRYFKHRNTFPAIKDISYFLILNIEILILYKLLGNSAFIGGVFAHIFILLILILGRILVYSIREKILILKNENKLNLTPLFFSSILLVGSIIWLILVLSWFFIVKDYESTTKLIFIFKILSSYFTLYTSLYFLSTYALSRIYINLYYTLINKILTLGLAYFLFYKIGIISFIVYFFVERIINTIIIKNSCDKTLKNLRVKLVDKSLKFSNIIKNSFWFINKNLIKRFMSLLLIEGQKILLIILVSKYAPNYLFIFFLFYQVISLFMLIPNRISKSMYYDITSLIYNNRLSLLRILLKKNLVIIILVGLLSTFLFKFLISSNLISKWQPLVINLFLFDKWIYIYSIVFFSSLILFINRFLLTAESHISLISLSLIFDYFLIYYLLINYKPFIQTHNPMFFFYAKGFSIFFYFLASSLLFFFPFWKKESIIARIKEIKFDNINQFLQKSKKIEKSNHIAILINIEKPYYRKNYLNEIIEIIKINFNPNSISYLNQKTLLLLVPYESNNLKTIKMNILAKLGLFSKNIHIIELSNPILDNKTLNQILTDSFPNLFNKNEIFIEEDIFKLLELKNIKYLFHKVKSNIVYLEKTNRSKEILILNNKVKDLDLPNFILKKDYLGLIPLIIDFNYVGILEIEYGANKEVILKLIRNIIYKNLLYIIKQLGSI